MEEKMQHMDAHLERRILNALAAADWSKIVNVTGQTFEEHYSGHMVFDVPTDDLGTIRLEVFNDCDEWDYVEAMTVGGTRYTWRHFSAGCDKWLDGEPGLTMALVNWHPVGMDKDWSAWGDPSDFNCEHR